MSNVSSQFVIEDISGSFLRASGGSARDDITMSDTIYQGVFLKLITSNIFSAFVDGNFAAVIFFAIVFGVALGRVVFKKTNVWS
jgi:Na+/H+-dicarboxylate symporter